MADIPHKWAERAVYDLDTARAMLEAKRYLYVLFCCQQAVEKLLKAVIAKRSEAFPPRLHQLVRLAESAQVPLNETQADFLRELSMYYIQCRYPEEIEDMSSQVSVQQARQVIEKTEELVRWLQSIL
ncbi:HEPN domain protein [Candidatus Methylomirabilis lanthanidiphila]|uniref:HEPN domain protein n=1 Tax=Candidatus Methylomirabilis lanthanidiphila TaxID=2211376 RepID=A0A564ZIZ1_9BACT|nr:HEPN domain-containing protein [Candidatus Methylomirabilis lanthanidiphila]VUZ85143.1 HEPN domain protein [Candidatus Methylomirabilis lanthanidiphila]